MKIMLCNDDGINAEGINVLHGLLVKKHEVFVIAPEAVSYTHLTLPTTPYV